METIDFNQVITENIGVVEELLPTASEDLNGLWNKNFTYKETPILPLIGDSLDLNKLHEYVNGGLSTIVVNAATLNPPPDSINSVCLHIQRVNKGNVSVSQIITQLVAGTAGIYRRYGKGNGSNINWSSWTLI